MAQPAVQFTTRIARFDPNELRLLAKNARYMRHETYAQLVANIRADGKLTSVPFAFLEDGKYTVLSGNHRVRAAIDAGIEEIEVMVTDEPLNREQQVAIQLSHNALSGEDNLSLLKSLYDEIDSVEMRAYAGLDDRTLALLDEINVLSMGEANLDFQIVPIAFLPHEAERAKAAFEEARKLVTGDEIWLARFGECDRFLDAIAAAGAAWDVHNMATAFGVLLGVFERHQEDLAEGWYGEDEAKHKNWVPLSSIYGTWDVPAESAQVMRKAVLKMRDHHDVSPTALWQAMEHWAADYLAGE